MQTDMPSISPSALGGYRPDPFSLNRIGTILLLLSLATYVLDAPSRYVLSLAKAESLLYLRDVLCALIVFCAIMSWRLGRSTTPVLIPTYVIAIHFFWGLVNLTSIAQPVVALKIYVTYLAGIVCFFSYQTHFKTAHKLIAWAYVLTATGVAINLVTDMPWTGTTFSSAVGDVSFSREWTSGGLSRVAGFARASSETSAFLALLCAPLLASRALNTAQVVALYLVTFALIGATTTKGGIIAWLLIGAMLPIIRRGSLSRAILLACAILAILGILIPAVIYLYDLKISVSSQWWSLLSSYADRINRMWPEALENVHQQGNFILGRGLGGIGFPQHFGEGRIYNSADSVMLYIYVSFGLLGLMYVGNILMLLAKKASQLNPEIGGTISIWLLYWFTYGLVGNNIDSAFMLFTAGLATGAAFEKAQVNE